MMAELIERERETRATRLPGSSTPHLAEDQAARAP